MQHSEPGAQPITQTKSRSAKSAIEKAIDPGKAKAAKKKPAGAKARTDMSSQDTAAPDTPVQQLIAMRAYEVWENQGRLHGHDVMHWQQAEREIQESLRDGALREKAKARKSPARSRL